MHVKSRMHEERRTRAHIRTVAPVVQIFSLGPLAVVSEVVPQHMLADVRAHVAVVVEVDAARPDFVACERDGRVEMAHHPSHLVLRYHPDPRREVWFLAYKEAGLVLVRARPDFVACERDGRVEVAHHPSHLMLGYHPDPGREVCLRCVGEMVGECRWARVLCAARVCLD